MAPVAPASVLPERAASPSPVFGMPDSFGMQVLTTCRHSARGKSFEWGVLMANRGPLGREALCFDGKVIENKE